jgi:hypothetical protein
MQIFRRSMPLFSLKKGGRQCALFFQPNGWMQELKLREQAHKRQHH